MEFQIKIKAKNRFFKKAKSINMNEIIDKLGFELGSYNDAYVLQLGEARENTCILYNPKCMGRGIYLDIRRLKDENEITLSYNIPTTKTEINDFFLLANEIINGFGEVELYNDDETFTIENLFEQKDTMIAFSLAELNQKSSLKYNKNTYILTLAMFPYALSDEERNTFSVATSLDEFEKRLHEVQLQDVYYAMPNLYHEENRDINIAVYTLTEDCRSAFPLDGCSSLITLKLNTQIDVPWVRFYIYSENRLIDGHFEYKHFIEFVKERSQEYLDKEHIIIPALNKEEITAMADHLKESGYLVV